MSEMMMMNSVLSRVMAAFDFLGYVFIVFMFITAIWKPNRIYSYSAFRYSLLLFAGTLAVPATVDMIWNAYNLISQTKTPTTNFGRSTPNEAQTMMLSSAIAANIARILMGSSVAVGILSLIDPDRRRREGMTLPPAGPMPRPEAPPQPHPLDRPAVAARPQPAAAQADPLTPIPLAPSSQPAAQARERCRKPDRPRHSRAHRSRRRLKDRQQHEVNKKSGRRDQNRAARLAFRCDS